MALAKFKMQMFANARELVAFVQTSADVSSVVSIVYDAASGKHVLYYMSP